MSKGQIVVGAVLLGGGFIAGRYCGFRSLQKQMSDVFASLADIKADMKNNGETLSKLLERDIPQVTNGIAAPQAEMKQAIPQKAKK